MKPSRSVFHVFIALISTALGLLLAYNMRRLEEYYIRSGVIRYGDGIFTCWREYSPSLIFILLVLLPAIVLLALYLHFRKPSLLRGGVELGLTALTVLVVPLANHRWAFWALILGSIGTGLIAGRDKAEKALLSIEGFTYGFLVLYLILGALAVSC